MKARFAIFLLILAASGLKAHPVHMSVANLDIHRDSSRIDYSIGVFYSDLQALINYRYNTLIDFDKKVSMTSVEQRAILEYISENFYFKNKGVILKHDFLRWKIEDGMIWLFFCTKYPAGFNHFELSNTIFLELYKDQKNFVMIREGNNETGIEMNMRLTSYQFPGN